MSLQHKHRYTLEEYLALERESEVRYEYWNGEVFAMSGGTLHHDRIMGNVFDLLRTQLRRKGCEVFTNNMQIMVPAAPPYRYADGSVVCGQVEVETFNSNDLLLNQLNILRQRLFDFGTKGDWIKKVQVLNYQEHLKLIEMIEAGDANVAVDFIRDVHCATNW